MEKREGIKKLLGGKPSVAEEGSLPGIQAAGLVCTELGSLPGNQGEYSLRFGEYLLLG